MVRMNATSGAELLQPGLPEHRNSNSTCGRIYLLSRVPKQHLYLSRQAHWLFEYKKKVGRDSSKKTRNASSIEIERAIIE